MEALRCISRRILAAPTVLPPRLQVELLYAIFGTLH
jgi:hypothetical protein